MRQFVTPKRWRCVLVEINSPLCEQETGASSGVLTPGRLRCPPCWRWRNSRRMAKSDSIEVEGRVVAALPNAMFRVQVDMGGEPHTILATISGRMRKYYIRILPGDAVQVEVSPYDLGRGRIVYRGKKPSG